jgi:flagellar FliL protein
MADDDTTPAPKKRGPGLVPILLGVNLLLVAGVLALFLLRGGPGGARAAAEPAAEHAAREAEKPAPADAAPGPVAPMADFVVHLRDAEVDRYARISFQVELASEAEKERFAAYTPRIRDGFIAFLSDRTLEELRGSAPVQKVKAQLLERLAQLAPGVKVRALYITDLVIQ